MVPAISAARYAAGEANTNYTPTPMRIQYLIAPQDRTCKCASCVLCFACFACGVENTKKCGTHSYAKVLVVKRKERGRSEAGVHTHCFLPDRRTVSTRGGEARRGSARRGLAMAMRWLAPVLLLAAFGPADGVGAGLRSARARRSLRAGAGVAADVDADASSSSATAATVAASAASRTWEGPDQVAAPKCPAPTLARRVERATNFDGRVKAAQAARLEATSAALDAALGRYRQAGTQAGNRLSLSIGVLKGKLAVLNDPARGQRYIDAGLDVARNRHGHAERMEQDAVRRYEATMAQLAQDKAKGHKASPELQELRETRLQRMLSTKKKLMQAKDDVSAWQTASSEFEQACMPSEP